MSAPRTIVALGGGSWPMEPENPLLDDYLLDLTGRERPKVAFLPTATGDSDRAVVMFHEAYQGRGVEHRNVRLFGSPSPEELRETLLSQDLVYVMGGNTANLLVVWRRHGVDALLREAWEAGTVLTGLSAGMLCWFEDGVTDSFGPLARLGDGLGFLPGSACPHYDGEHDRRTTYHALVREGMPAGHAADDGVGLVWRGRDLVECVSSRPQARAYRVALDGGEVVEDALPTRYLGAAAP